MKSTRLNKLYKLYCIQNKLAQSLWQIIISPTRLINLTQQLISGCPKFFFCTLNIAFAKLFQVFSTFN